MHEIPAYKLVYAMSGGENCFVSVCTLDLQFPGPPVTIP